MHKMSLVALAALSVLAVMAEPPPLSSKVYYDTSKAEELFETFIKDYNRVYKDDADKQLHYQAFLTNLEKINEMNKKSPSAVFGINKFADYTEEETKAMRGLKKPNN